MSRAERFEDEKRRIIESCFAKSDPNGQREFLPTSIRSPSAYQANLSTVKLPNHTSLIFASKKMPRILKPLPLLSRRRKTRNRELWWFL